MNGGDRHEAGYTLAIGGAAAALVVVIVGASTIAALHREVPKELWGIGGALAGAIVGILVPSPRMRGKRDPLGAAEATIRAAKRAASGEAKKKQCAAAKAGAEEAVKEVDKAGQEAVNDLAALIGESEQVSTGSAMAAASRVVQVVQNRYRAAKDAADLTAAKADQAAAAARDAAARDAAAGRAAAAARDAAGTPAASVADAETEAKVSAALADEAKTKAKADDERVQAKASVHKAAEEAAASAVTSAGPGGLSAFKSIASEAKILVPLVLFITTLTLGLLLGLGVIKAVPCKAASCSYYSTVTHQTANVLISLAAATVGALVGMFAQSPAEAAQAAASK